MSILLLYLSISSSFISIISAKFSTYVELRNGAHEGMSEWSSTLEDLIFLAQQYKNQGLVLVEPCIKDAQLVGCHTGGSFPVSFAYDWHRNNQTFNWITWKERQNKKLHNPNNLYHVNCKLQKKFGEEGSHISPKPVVPTTTTTTMDHQHRYLQKVVMDKDKQLPRFEKIMEDQKTIEDCVKKVVNLKGIICYMYSICSKYMYYIFYIILLRSTTGY